jgi:hypothetical protein
MSWDEGRNETTAVTIAHEQFNIVQSPQVGFVDGRRACVRGGRAGHLPRRQDGVVCRDGVGGWAVGDSSPDAQKDILCDTLGAICSLTLFLLREKR